jgi:hypothetical protein
LNAIGYLEDWYKYYWEYPCDYSYGYYH